MNQVTSVLGKLCTDDVPCTVRRLRRSRPKILIEHEIQKWLYLISSRPYTRWRTHDVCYEPGGVPPECFHILSINISDLLPKNYIVDGVNQHHEIFQDDDNTSNNDSFIIDTFFHSITHGVDKCEAAYNSTELYSDSSLEER